MSSRSSFEDYFSAQAADYARYRPHYPAQLFEYLASVAPGHSLAWDCGTGNGQAAVALAEHFERVIATDASAEQLAHAMPHERVEYRVEAAEAVSLPPHSADLATVTITGNTLVVRLSNDALPEPGWLASLVEAMERTSTSYSCVAPTGRTRRSWRTRSSLACVSGSISVISSRKSVPLSAARTRC